MDKKVMTQQINKNDIVLDIKKNLLLDEAEFNRDEFPILLNLSSAFFYQYLPIPREKKLPEFVFLKDYYENNSDIEKDVTIAEWNIVWEVGQLRTDFFWQRLPNKLNWLKNYENENIYLIPD